ncbi:hypothetical protein BDA96_08G132900 [Sorghum bicolor]|uniref:Uncharacterized protein n=1 Tax=Sorghum bicolor TaxID=4558 RepID=A0A921U714_SORBI|nr:hypothetical protein BDA96_08G132900 [Sorghum bicolor]
MRPCFENMRPCFDESIISTSFLLLLAKHVRHYRQRRLLCLINTSSCRLGSEDSDTHVASRVFVYLIDWYRCLHFDHRLTVSSGSPTP